MGAYKTSATVQEQGQVHLAGVPFGPGTEVEITIEPTQNARHEAAAAHDRAARLFAALDKAPNTEAGSLHREELYDRNVVR